MCLTDFVDKHFVSLLQSNLAIAIVDDLNQSNPIVYSKKTLIEISNIAQSFRKTRF